MSLSSAVTPCFGFVGLNIVELWQSILSTLCLVNGFYLQLKRHSQLGHMRIRYHFMANLHVTILVPRTSVSFGHVVGKTLVVLLVSKCL